MHKLHGLGLCHVMTNLDLFGFNYFHPEKAEEDERVLTYVILSGGAVPAPTDWNLTVNIPGRGVL